MLRVFSLSVASLLAVASPHPAQRPVEPRPAMRVANPEADDSATAIVDVTVIPMDRERTLPGQTVLVEHGRITALGPVGKVRIPANARRVDGRRKFLIPGLSDMHVHLQSRDSMAVRQSLLLLVANGVTTVRNMDYHPLQDYYAPGVPVPPEVDMTRLRAQVASGQVLGPRIYTSGWWGDSSSGSWAPAPNSVPTAEQVEHKIAAYKAKGYDFVKVRDESPAVYRMLVAAAKKVGIPFAGHVPEGVSVEEVIASGQQSIEHLKGYMPAIRRHSTEVPKIIAATKAARVWNDPNMLQIAENFANYVSTDTLDWPELKRYFSAKDYQLWQARIRELRELADTAAVVPFDSTSPPPDDWFGDMPGRRGSLAAARRFVKALQDSGAGLLTGTDLIGAERNLIPEFAVHHELQALVRAGLTPYQTLVASTRNAADFLGTRKETGTVAVGKRADLVLLNGNPLADIRNTMLPAGVLVAGRWLSRTELDARLADWHPGFQPF